MTLAQSVASSGEDSTARDGRPLFVECPTCRRARPSLDYDGPTCDRCSGVGFVPADRNGRDVQVDEAVARAVLHASYGAPSTWGGPNPPGWHLPEPCTPRDASMHDNGVVDAFKALRAAQRDTLAQSAAPGGGDLTTSGA